MSVELFEPDALATSLDSFLERINELFHVHPKGWLPIGSSFVNVSHRRKQSPYHAVAHLVPPNWPESERSFVSIQFENIDFWGWQPAGLALCAPHVVLNGEAFGFVSTITSLNASNFELAWLMEVLVAGPESRAVVDYAINAPQETTEWGLI